MRSRIGSEENKDLLYESDKVIIDKYQTVEFNDLNII